MSEELIRSATKKFCRRLVELHGPKHLRRRPTEEELKSIESAHRSVGFPGCIGSVDCMRQLWKNCPKALKGQYYNPKDGRIAVISVEAWCDRDLYVWHWFSGRCGTNNDITVLDASPLFNDILSGAWKPDFEWTVGEESLTIPYFLVDGIYPKWAIFAKPLSVPVNEKEARYTKCQEAVRKDIERCFGVLQARFHALRGERKEWRKSDIVLMGQACVILHNMIIDMGKRGLLASERDESGRVLTCSEIVEESFDDERSSEVKASEDCYLENLLMIHTKYTSRAGFISLRNRLRKNLWNILGQATATMDS